MASKRSRRLNEARHTLRPWPSISAILGGALVGVCALCLGWIFLHRPGAARLPALPSFIIAPTSSAGAQIGALTAEGITLGQASQAPGLSQQQAIFIANQLEPVAAAGSVRRDARYVLLHYPSQSTPAARANYKDVPSWMVIYQKIPLKPADTAVDPGPSSRSSYDLYVFLDAQSGRELLTVQV
jgi:hypothetical protein